MPLQTALIPLLKGLRSKFILLALSVLVAQAGLTGSVVAQDAVALYQSVKQQSGSMRRTSRHTVIAESLVTMMPVRRPLDRNQP